MPFRFPSLLAAATLGLVLALPEPAFTAGKHNSGHGEENGRGHASSLEFGEPGKPSEVGRTIEIVMKDNYFEPEKIAVQAGETIRFVVKNEGEFLHEFNLGTAAMHAEHQEEMMTMMEHGMLTATGIDHDKMKMDHAGTGMSGHTHDDPNSVLIEPGQSQELVWKFAAQTGLEFACNVPGHYESGMMGEIEFDKQPRPASGS